MDRAVDIDGGQSVAAQAELSEFAAMLGRLVEYAWKRESASRVALRRERVDAQRGLMSLIALWLDFAAQLVAQWIGCAVDTIRSATVRSSRHLRHPPQAWAAP